MMCKQRFVCFLSVILLLVFISSPLLASEVTIPNNFTAGTPAKAAEVNGNFTAVKNAVDDNYTRLPLVWASTNQAQDIQLAYTAAIELNINNVSVAIPSDGVITISGSIITQGILNGMVYLIPKVDGTNILSNQFLNAAAWDYAYNNSMRNLSYSLTIPVSAGNHTIAQILKCSSGGTMRYSANNLTVIYFPAAQSSYKAAP